MTGSGDWSPDGVWGGSPNVLNVPNIPRYFTRKYTHTSAPSAMRYHPKAAKLLRLM